LRSRRSAEKREDEMSNDGNGNAQRYWARNLRLLLILLSIWWVVSFGFGILWADALDAYTIPGTGFKVGFWFAQQGSIYVFVALIFIYARLMSKLDEEFGVHED
jgi:putative solute:sodium symporter small subunit